MTRRRKDPLRTLTEEERSVLESIARARSEPASHVARAKIVLAVADGATYRVAALAAGRQSNDAVAQLVARFNVEGLAAIAPRHGQGRAPLYTAAQRERIVQEARRVPDRDRDGTATWTLSSLQRALRSAPDGLPNVSTYTIWAVLHEAGLTWQQSRTWCETGQVKRRRKSGVVTVKDPDAEAKKT
jgi:transposase